jgi:Mg-chelatase subunit ChlD
MTIEVALDYPTLLRHHSQPVHLAVRFKAHSGFDAPPRQPAAFCFVVDRSGSMAGAPLAGARGRRRHGCSPPAPE